MRPFRPWRNPFETIASVSCVPGGHGTVLRVTLRDRYFVAIYMSLWLGVGVFINLNAVYQAVIGNLQITTLLLTLLIPAAFWADLAIGRFRARSDALELLEFIQEASDAEELAPELRPIGA